MTMHPQAWSRIRSFQWHWSEGVETSLCGVEDWVSGTGNRGWLQRTRPSGPVKNAVPDTFLLQLRVWRHFLAHHAIREFQLRHTRRAIRLWGPPPRFVNPAPEWQLWSALTNQACGALVVSHACRVAQFPFRDWTDHLRSLLAIPLLKPRSQAPGPIFFRGDLLLGFLDTALDHLFRDTAAGTWLRRDLGVKVFRGVKAPGKAFAREEGDEGERDPEPACVLPTHFRFLANRRHAIPNVTWHALHYDPDRHLLYCHDGKTGSRSYCALVLAQPLYRFFPHLCFGSGHRGRLIRGNFYEIPSAVLVL